VQSVGSWVLQSNNVVAEGLAASLDKPLEWAVGSFFGNPELSMEPLDYNSRDIWVRRLM